MIGILIIGGLLLVAFVVISHWFPASPPKGGAYFDPLFPRPSDDSQPNPGHDVLHGGHQHHGHHSHHSGHHHSDPGGYDSGGHSGHSGHDSGSHSCGDSGGHSGH